MREWEGGDHFDDGYGFSADNNVGKKSREIAKAKAREAQRQLEADNDEPDWFNMNHGGSRNEMAKAKPFRGKSSLPLKPSPPVIRFGVRDSSFSKPPSQSGNRARPNSGPSLRELIDVMGRRQPTEPSHRNGGRKEIKGKDWRKEKGESRHGDLAERPVDSYISSDEPHRDRGRKWRGGYER